MNDLPYLRFVHKTLFELLAELFKNELGDHCNSVSVCAAIAAATATTVTAGLTCLSVGADVCGVLTLHTKLTADLVKSLNLSICELLGAAENL